jgi:ubiquinone/menaquinone biosynthesis C-methylase UbiE
MVEALETTGTFPPLAVENHRIRMERVRQLLLQEGVSSFLDIGCGDGAFIARMQAEPSIAKITGLDDNDERLGKAKQRLSSLKGFGKVALQNVCMLGIDDEYAGHDAAVLIETIEHIPPDLVPKLEERLFNKVEPRVVIVTTPDATNRLTEEKMQQRGHLFEWNVPEFEQWVESVTDAYPYYGEVSYLNGPSFIRGTQIAIFRKATVVHNPQGM